MMVITYMGQGLKRDTALAICNLSKHQFYYRAKNGNKAGKPVSTQTLHRGKLVDNSQVITLLKEIQSNEDTNYGYRKMSYQLSLLGFVINHKKVYRMMGQAHLLKEKIRPGREKKYVRYRTVTPERPLHVLEMDIKMVWLVEHRRHAYILNVIDTFTRVVLYWSVGYQMKQEQINQGWREIIKNHLQPNDLLREDLHVELRNDNGPQFSAGSVKAFLAENHIHQTFTHPYTPEENGHVESFHNILKKALGKQPYWSLAELEIRLEAFYQTYNEKRIHASTAYLAPILFWKCWQQDLIERIVLEKKKVRFKLKIPYQKLSGFRNLREVLCVDFEALDGLKNQNKATACPI
ncbi:DDE-type integrase/transposase/recombinase [Lutimonas sp.]|uniref:DDE-type integrase/transposase/recombinase n=1 Tax=Lutimonas sp. TaxID=1872403 RepID=UPI003C71FDB2